MNEFKLGRITIDHPDARARARGETSIARLQLWTETGRDRSIVLSEEDLIKLLVTGSKVLGILRGVRLP